MRIIKANLWNFYRWENKSPICITTNGIIKGDGKLVMGAGIAKEATQQIKGIDEKLGILVSLYGNNPYYIYELGVISFPTKHHFKDKSPIELIAQSAIMIRKIWETYRLNSIYSTWPGCGNGGLTKEIVEPVLSKIWNKDNFVVVEKP